jgi:predicted transcriptional regulator
MTYSSDKQNKKQKKKQKQKHRLTERDLKVIELLENYKMLTTSQIQQLIYPSIQKAQTRLLLLFEQGIVKRFPYPVLIKDTGKGEYVYHLKNQQGNTLIKLQHHIKLNDIRIMFEKTFNQESDIRLVDFIPEYSGKVKIEIDEKDLTNWKPTDNSNLSGFQIIPDATIVLKNATNEKQALFFLELDLGSEKLFTENKNQYALFQKLQKYQQYLTRQNYQQFNKMFNYQFKGFRVLLLMNKTSRMQKMISTLNSHKIYKLVWITHIADIRRDAIKDKIWTTTATSDTVKTQGENQIKKYSIITD